MKAKQNNPLWIKIENFPLDDAGATINFSTKLSASQNWSPAFTKRVVEEYKKFIFLCCISEKGASPSQIIDEAWHLHLTYTQSYWIDFCKNTLGKDIHHHPSKGGTSENHKHEDWYKETLQLYETVFGMAPPAIIWPAPKDIGSSNIDSPKISVDNRARKWAAAFLALPFLCSGLIYQTFHPFYLTGPQFLFFYFFFGLAVIAAYAVIQKKKEIQVQQIVEDNIPGNASVFQIAQFLYGKHRAVQTAIVDLIRRDLLVVNKDKSMFVFSDRYSKNGKDENPFMPSFIKTVHGHKVFYKEIVASWYNEQAFSHPALTNLYLFANKETPFLQTGIFYVMLVATGVARMIQGLSHNRPVIYLFFEMAILTIALYAVIKSVSSKSLVYKKAAQLFAKKLSQQKRNGNDLVNDFVMRGTPAIAGFAEGFLLAAVFNANLPLSQRRGGDGGSPWSGCGGSGGDSGGGGGSGCGGGGCGGCGGGGD